MIDIIVALAAFLTLFVVGLAITTALRGSTRRLSNALLAPSIGAAALIISTWIVSHFAPVERFAIPLVTAALCLAVAALLFQRTYRLPAVCAGFGLVIGLAIVFAGWPAFRYGDHWLSISNDDGLNYILSAQRFLHQTFSQIPDGSTLISGRDRSLSMWFVYGLHGDRAGGDLLLAVLARCSGLSAMEALMPALLALEAVLISTAAAFALKKPFRVCRSLLVTAALSASPLILFGTVLQLLGQAAGLPLFVATTLLALDSMENPQARSALREGGLLAIALIGLLLAYFELAPIAASICVVYGAWSLWTRRLKIAVIGKTYATAALLTCVFLNTQLIYIYAWLHERVRQTEAHGYSNLFPQYRLPSGLAYLWGLAGIYEDVRDPWLSVEIAVGALLLFCVVVWAAINIFRGRRDAYAFIAMAALGVTLLRDGNGYGLFKIAMYVQPFLWTCFVGLALDIGVRLTRARRWTVLTASGLAAIVVCCTFNAHAFYLHFSSDAPVAGVSPYGEVAHASSSDYYTQMSDAVRSLKARHEGPILSDAFSLSMMKYQAEFAGQEPLIFAGSDFLQYQAWLQGPLVMVKSHPQWFGMDRMTAAADAMAQAYARLHPVAIFDLKAPRTRGIPFTANLSFDEPDLLRTNAVLWHTTSAQSVVNNKFAGDQRDIAEIPIRNAVNILVPVDSPSATLIPWAKAHIGLSEIEADPWFPLDFYDGIGHYLLLEVVGSTPTFRIHLNVTNAYLPFWQLPRITIVGDRRYNMPVVGAGSASIVSPPLRPQRILGHNYIVIETERSPGSRVEPRTGLMGLYGTHLLQDGRQLSILVRGIWADATSVAVKRPPADLAHFPASLRDGHLVYSGIDEYGRVGDAAYVQLEPKRDGSSLVVCGEVTRALKTAGSVTLDGHTIGIVPVQPGSFSVVHRILADGKPHVIGLYLGKTASPAGRLSAIGFYSSEYVKLHSFDIIPLGTGLRLVGNGWYDPEEYQGQTFRWVNTRATIALAGHLSNGELKAEIEPGPEVPGSPVPRLLVTNRRHAIVFAAPLRGHISLSLPFVASEAYTLSAEGVVSQKAPDDPRTLSFRVFHVRIAGTDPHDITKDTPAQLSGGWQPLETFAGERFRWFGPDAIVNGASIKPTRMYLEVGPGVAHPPMRLSVSDASGHDIAHFSLTGRRWISLPPSSFYALHVENGGTITGNDPRELDARVLEIEQ